MIPYPEINGVKPPLKIVIATPMLGWDVGGAHHASMWPLCRASIDTQSPRFEIIDPRLLVDMDLVRARSRCVRLFLDETDGDKLLFVDADIAADVRALRGMIAADVDCIGSTYPKKRLDAYGLPRDYAMLVEPRTPIRADHRSSIRAVGLGFTLLSRELLQQMVVDLDDALGADDEGKRTSMLFMLMFHKDARGKRHLMPEDYSFCARVREYTDVWLYTGLGAPLAHEGHHIFKGRAEDCHPRLKPEAELEYEDEAGVMRVWGDDRP
jgi:hypothetical protein